MVRQISEAANAAGIPRPVVIWVLQGPDRSDPQRVRRLNAIYTEVAKAAGDRTAAGGWFVSLAANPADRGDCHGIAPRILPCTEIEVQYGYCTMPKAFGGVERLHMDHDLVCFCLEPSTPTPRPCRTKSPRAVRYSAVIAYEIIQSL